MSYDASGPQTGRSGPSMRLWLAVGAVAVIAIIAIVAIVVAPKDGGAKPSAVATATAQPAATATATQAPEPEATPAAQPTVAAFTGTAPSTAKDSAIEIGPASAKTVVEVYYDYICPFCGMLEKQHGKDLERLSEEGKINLVYHPMSFLDRASNGTNYSTRAANAFATAADADPASAVKFSQALFDNQPEENTDGLSDAKIAELAKAAGVKDEVIAAFGSMKFKPWVEWATQADFASGITGTPTVKINGEPFTGNWQTGTALIDAINQAAS